MNENGFTLIEILITVSLILILSSIGFPIYNGYIKESKISLAKSNLNSIYLAEINYFYENHRYYITGTTCGNHNEVLIKDLFLGEAVINKDLFKFCIIENNDGFIAKAIGENDQEITIDNMNNLKIMNKG
jgi:prepilin-type N-terminal cleavage/methylation domain-containing protein